jgi:hypothetical protein
MSNILHLPKAQHSTNDRPEPAQIVCSACGATADAACACGAPYLPAGERAAKAVIENPGMSDRGIADQIGVSHPTVAKARKQSTGKDLPVEKRTGRDGKARKLPAPKANAKERRDWRIILTADLDANEIANQLIERNQDQDDLRKVLAQLRKVVSWVADHVRHPDRTPMERAVARGLAGRVSVNGPLGKTAALAALREPESSSSLWAVEVIDKAGKRWRNKVNFYSKEEAEAYGDVHARQDVPDYVRAEIVQSDDSSSNCSMFRRKGGRMILLYPDGSCGTDLQVWRNDEGEEVGGGSCL